MENQDRTFKEMLRENTNMILEEMDQQSQRIYKRMDSVEQNIRADMIKNKNELSHEINAVKLNCDCIPVMIQKLEDHEKRITALENRTA